MKKYAKFLSLITATAMLCSCARIPDYSDPVPLDPVSDPNSGGEDSEKPTYNEQSVKKFNIINRNFITKLNAEGGVFDGTVSEDGEFDGKGYVKLKSGNTLTHIVNANTPQHYRLILAARSEEGAAISLKINNKTIDHLYIPEKKSAENEESDFKFEYYAVDCVYLTAGQNIVRFYVESGSADVDYILAENSDMVDPDCYRVGSACANPSASLNTVNVMRFLSDVYGKYVLTAQNVSPASNAEIDAIYNATGRYPAIRCEEFAYATSDTEKDTERVNKEVELAVEWAKNGGLQSYIWHWYSPNYRNGVNPNDFNLETAFYNQRPEEIALMGDNELQAQINGGFIPPELSSLLNDIDRIAEILKKFDDENVTILFQPIPDGDSGMYWWGNDSENYKILWRLLFDRLCNYHKIKCLIWVWNGSNMDFYPGDAYVDIVGQSFYEKSDSSFAGRFEAISTSVPTKKILSLTSCDVLPDIDLMYRDNALWLWAAAGAGELTIDEYGKLSETYNSVHTLKYFYNCEATLARDELPKQLTIDS